MFSLVTPEDKTDVQDFAFAIDTDIGQKIQQFHDKNGADCIFFKGMYFYSNGATRERDFYAPLNDPPMDIHERYKNQVIYHKETLRRAIKSIEDFKNIILQHAEDNLNKTTHTYYPAITQEQATASLKELQAIVKACQVKLDVILNKQANVMPYNIDNTSASNRVLNDELVDAVNSIYI
jgi:hypothetical protein